LSRIVVDASVALSWCFPDEQTDSSMGVLDRLQSGEQAITPAFWAVEVLNTLLVGERKGRITAEQTATFLDTLKILNPVLPAMVQILPFTTQIILSSSVIVPCLSASRRSRRDFAARGKQPQPTTDSYPLHKRSHIHAPA